MAARPPGDGGPLLLDAADVDLAGWIRPGDGVLWSQGCGEPTGLVDRLIAQSEEIGGLTAFCGVTWREVLADAPHLDVVSFGALGSLAAVAARRPVRVVPCHFSALPRLFAAGRLPGDVALLQVAPPDAGGRCSLGVDASYTPDAIRHARVVIAEVNDRMPSTPGDSIGFDELDAVVPVSRPLVAAPPARENALAARVADRVVELVGDGDTVQVGVGTLPELILDRLRDRRDLGVHSGMVSDPLVDLVECGAVTGARKPVDTGLVVTGAALGSERLFDFLGESGVVRLRSVTYTNQPDVLARVGRLVAINGAVEVDLTGQVNAEVAAGRLVGAIGGQADFMRAASAGGGLAVIALPSIVGSTSGSRIVPALSGPVTTARSDVDVVVTEHGAAWLRGRDLAQRAAALIEIAAPEHRDQLARAAA